MVYGGIEYGIGSVPATFSDYLPGAKTPSNSPRRNYIERGDVEECEGGRENACINIEYYRIKCIIIPGENGEGISGIPNTSTRRRLWIISTCTGWNPHSITLRECP